MTDPAFATAEEFARLVEVGSDALARKLAAEMGVPQGIAYLRVKAASADLDGYLREGRPDFWASIVRTRVTRDLRPRYTVTSTAGSRKGKRYAVLDTYGNGPGGSMARVSWHRTVKEAKDAARARNTAAANTPQEG